MAIRRVIRLGNPVLRQVAEAYSEDEIRSAETQAFLEDMFETMDAYDGAGLAAPQVAISKRLMVYGVDANPRYPEAERVPRTALFNPKWEALGEGTSMEWEGCLSLPGLRGKVRRFDHIKVTGLDRDAQPVEFEAHDFHARVFQHEYDHLDGIVFVDRMEDMSTLSYLAEWAGYVLPVELGRASPEDALAAGYQQAVEESLEAEEDEGDELLQEELAMQEEFGAAG